MAENGEVSKGDHMEERGCVTAADDVVIVYATFPTFEHAQKASRGLVEARLAACVNIIPQMTAVYAWDGTLHEDAEVVALIKTRRDLSCEVIARVSAEHPYTNPALIVIEVAGGSARYLDWVRETRAA